MIVILTTFPLRSILHKLDLFGQMTKWAVELSEHDIYFQPQTAIKSQVIANFIANFTPNTLIEAGKELMILQGQNESKRWQVQIDGSNNMKGSELGLILTLSHRDKVEKAGRSNCFLYVEVHLFIYF